MADLLPPLKPIPIKDRLSVLFVEKGNLDVLDGAFVVVDKTGVRTHVPIGGVACLMLEPGTRVSHAAAAATVYARPRFRIVFPAPAGIGPGHKWNFRSHWSFFRTDRNSQPET